MIALKAFLVAYLCASVLGFVAWKQISSAAWDTMAELHRTQNQRTENKNPASISKGDGIEVNSSLHSYLNKTVAADFNDIFLVESGTQSMKETELSQRWVDYYPGNLRWKAAVNDYALTWWNYHGLPHIFTEAIIDHIIWSSAPSSDSRPLFVRRNPFGNWEELSKPDIWTATENALLEWWTLPLIPQRWGPPLRLMDSPCSLPRTRPSSICDPNTIQISLKRLVFPQIASKEKYFFESTTPRLCREPSKRSEATVYFSTPRERLLTINDRIEARYNRGSHWVNGKVAQLYEIGASRFYDVQFGYWGFHQMLPEEFVREKRVQNDKVKTLACFRLKIVSSQYSQHSWGRQSRRTTKSPYRTKRLVPSSQYRPLLSKSFIDIIIIC